MAGTGLGWPGEQLLRCGSDPGEMTVTELRVGTAGTDRDEWMQVRCEQQTSAALGS